MKNESNIVELNLKAFKATNDRIDCVNEKCDVLSKAIEVLSNSDDEHDEHISKIYSMMGELINAIEDNEKSMKKMADTINEINKKLEDK